MEIVQIARQARIAARTMAGLPDSVKNEALRLIRAELESNEERIFAENRLDLDRSQAENLAAPLLKRLKFGPDKLAEVLAGLDSLAAMADPVGRTLLSNQLDDHLNLYRVSCPIGVIGVIFESRPDALVQIAGLCLKSGNALLLKGGSEAARTNRVLTDLITRAGEKAGLPPGWIGLLETRAEVTALLSMDQDVDLLIPRGSNEFVRYIMDHTRIPVLGHADGVCHLYIDASADAEMAIRLALDSKTQYAAVCNAVETILVHRSLKQHFVPALAKALSEAGVEILGCPEICAMLDCAPVEDWHTEYLDLKVSLRLVDDMDDAISHIHQYGSGHTEAIVAGNRDTAAKFLLLVDAGNVFWNCSTRFSDGFRYGFGAEVGVSTSKLHARGPVGLDGLLTYKYKLLGSGQTVREYASGEKIFHHASRQQDCPL